MKRIISLILVLVLAVGLMATASGCKKNGADTDLLKGMNIRIASWGSAKPTEGTQDGDLKLAAIEAACEKYGCTVEWLTISDLTQQLLSSATSGTVVADVVMQRAHRVVELQMKGDNFWALEDLDGQPNKEFYNTDTTKYTTYKGKTYGFWYDPTNVNVMMAINKDIIARAGADLPYNLVEDKKWTMAEWVKLMNKTFDPNTGVYGGTVYSTFPLAMLHSNQTGMYTQDANGVHVANTDSKAVSEVLELICNAVVNDKTVVNNMGTAANNIVAEFMNGKYTTIQVGRANCRDNLAKKMTDNWGIMPMPMGPSATDYVKLDNECKTFAIQKAVDLELAKALLKFMDETYICPMDPTEVMRSMYQGFAPDKESLENLMMLQELPLTLMDEYTTPDLRNYPGNAVSANLNEICVGNKPVKSTLDAMKPEIQGILDDYYGQGK